MYVWPCPLPDGRTASFAAAANVTDFGRRMMAAGRAQRGQSSQGLSILMESAAPGLRACEARKDKGVQVDTATE
jgi:hypothetical protein